MARVTTVKKAQKDIPNTDIKKGDSYYWWKFRFGGKHFSKTPPKRSQLTQSGFLSQLYDLQDRIAEFTAEAKEDFDSFKEEIMSEIENLKDECQNSLDNMPEHLQEGSSSGQTLTERIDALDNWYSEIDGIECEEYDEENIREEKLSEYEKEEGELEDDYKERIDQETADAIEEIVNNAVEELTGTDCGI